ncbi:MAG: 4Fe-4S dicluster domain-containing protein [Candidatus Omnitrophota bacterium]
MEKYFIQKKDFIDFLKELSSGFRIFYLKQDKTSFYWKEGQRKILYWQEYKDSFDDLILDEVRSQDPLKQFVFSSREKVSENFHGEENKKNQPILLIGAKNCDLSGLDVSDFVFMQGDFKDPFYINKRESLFIIASDCNKPIDTCFCLALDKKPYPEKNFDLAVCDIEEGYIVEAVGERSNNYISKHKSKFSPVTYDQLQKRENSRKETIQQLEANIKNNGIPNKSQLSGIMDKGFESDIWQEEIKTCVECGCCNTICPTCHCFFLGDSKEENKNIRYKIWDACLYKDFAVVAGGANPRKRLFQRLRNRYDKKFNFFPNVAGIIACTGCGRCISGCPAKIDIRRILKNLVKVKISV